MRKSNFGTFIAVSLAIAWSATQLFAAVLTYSQLAAWPDPYGIAVDTSGNVYVGSNLRATGHIGSNSVAAVTSGGTVTTLYAGSGAPAFNPFAGLAVDSTPHIFLADTYGQQILKITTASVVTVFTNRTSGQTVPFNGPVGLAVDSSGNVYVGDYKNNSVQKITPTLLVTNMGPLLSYVPEAEWEIMSGAAQFTYPAGLAVDSSGNIYVADSGSYTIRKITAPGVWTTLAGQPRSMYGTFQGGTNDGTGTAAQFHSPSAVAVDTGGDVFVADMLNHTIRKVTSGGVVTTVGGVPGVPGNTLGVATVAHFNYPFGIACKADGTILYVADTLNNRIVKGQ